MDAVKWFKNVARALKRGHLITIDYGDTAGVVHTATSTTHKLAVNAGTGYIMPGSKTKLIYEWVGGVDITTPVDFTAIQKTGESLGFKGSFLIQAEFLAGIGALKHLVQKALLNDRNLSIYSDQMRQLLNNHHKVLVQGKRI